MDKKKDKKSYIIETLGHWLGLLFVIVVGIVVYFGMNSAEDILNAILSVFGMIKPVIYGCVIAYILNPLMKWFQEIITKLFERTGKKLSDKAQGAIKGASIFISIIFMLLSIVILCWMIIPQLIISISNLTDSLPSKVNDFYAYINSNIKNNKFLADKMQTVALDVTDYADEMVKTKLLPWVQSELLPNVNILAKSFASGLMGFITVLYNLFIGMIVAIYLLASKETFSGQSKKILFAVFRRDIANVILHYIKITDRMFSGFIIGKIVDSAIMGIICFFVLQIAGIPYAMLVSVIVGVTNIIPVFGPYIGLIPSVFLILLVNPIQALYFIIIIAILQQIDGNLIGPAILGESTGLSAFWVLFSILLFGGMWGIIGMIVGVPLFAVIYRIVSDFINWKLGKKNLSLSTDDYINLNEIRVDGDNYEYIEKSNTEKKSKRKEINKSKIYTFISSKFSKQKTEVLDDNDKNDVE